VSSEQQPGQFFDADTTSLLGLFPEARLTIRDRLPINLVLTNAVITIQKSILNIEYSAEEIKEAVQGFVAMIPEDLYDQDFVDEIKKAKQLIPVDVRPSFCEHKASLEWCEKRGIPVIQYVQTFDYFKVFHACFNLLQRRNMLLKQQPKEIATGRKARKEQEKLEETDEEPEL
jgi:hypothetical protein